VEARFCRLYQERKGMLPMKTVVIEISGGVVQEVYADEDIRTIVVDWDDQEGDAKQSCAAELKPHSLDAMPEETEQQVKSLA
jgi:hypothetical protein